MAVVCSSLILCLLVMLLRYCVSDFYMVPVSPVITGITFTFIFLKRRIYIMSSLCSKIFSASFLITLLSQGILSLLHCCCRCSCLLSQAFSSWYFSWTNGDPHRSGFNFQTAVLSVLRVMFQMYAAVFVVNLFNFTCYGFQIFPKNFCYYSGGSNYYWYNLTFHYSHSL